MVPFKYGRGNSKVIMNPANTIEISCMTGAFIMAMIKKASRDGALKARVFRYEHFYSGFMHWW